MQSQSPNPKPPHQDADKDQHRDQIKKCHECMTKECKDNCKDILEKAKSAKKHTSAHKAKKLGLKMSDLKLLADAQKRQKKEGAKAIYMAKMDKEAYDHRNGGHSGSSGLSSLNHVPGDTDGQGDWAPGMRSNALAQLKEEEKQAAQTAKFAQDTDNDDSWGS